MKRLINASDRYTPKGGYLYIFKHGIGPGTMPSDAHIVKVKDLPNYYTAVWLDRFLTTDEMKQYDIPFETDINYYLDRIGYCQKDGDVVPCDDVEACDKVMAAKTARWSKLSDSDQFAVEYAISYLDSNYGGIENISNDDYLVDAARYGCNVVSEGNAEPEYENEDFYMDEPDFDKVFNYLKSKSSCQDITCATDIDDDEEDEIYWVQAYYGTPRRGMATDFATNDWDEAIDKLVEYANQGYHVVFENLASGEGYAYDADEILEAVSFGDIYTLRRLESLYEG